MPADDRVRLDEDQGGTLGGPVAGEPGPEEAISGPESGSARQKHRLWGGKIPSVSVQVKLPATRTRDGGHPAPGEQ